MPLSRSGKRLAEIGDPVVVDAADLGEELGIRYAIPEEALARLEDRTPDASSSFSVIIASAV